MEMSHEMNTAVPLVFGCFWLFIALAMSVFVAVVYCKIFGKAGYHWALGLLMFIPVANLIMLCVLAFSEWPIEKEIKAFRQATQAPEHQNFRGV